MNQHQKKYTVLFVDDEPRVLSALRAIFRREYKVLTANGGEQALELLAIHHIDVVVSDQRMPGMLGSELLAQISKRFPQTMRVLLTGFMDKQAIIDSINEGDVYRFVNKPWNNDDVRRIVAEASAASEQQIEEPAAPGEIGTQNKMPHSLPVGEHAMLMIERSADVRNQIRKFCQDNKIMIYGTQNVDQAVAAAATRRNIGVAIVELAVDPDVTLQVINMLKIARPEMIAIALTDEYDAQTAVELINQGQVFKYLSKPIDTSRFQNAIQNAFLRHNFLKTNKVAQTRYKVEKSKSSLFAGLQSMFSRLTGVVT